MYVAEDRFDEPLCTEGYHPRRIRDLDDTPVPYSDGIAGLVAVVRFSVEDGMTYEQTEPVGDNWHHSRGWPLTTVRP